MRKIARARAIELGLSRYFTGEACLRGHVAERLVSNYGCVACKGEKYSGAPPDRVCKACKSTFVPVCFSQLFCCRSCHDRSYYTLRYRDDPEYRARQSAAAAIRLRKKLKDPAFREANKKRWQRWRQQQREIVLAWKIQKERINAGIAF